MKKKLQQASIKCYQFENGMFSANKGVKIQA